jgi:hypothetical protein
MTLVLHVSTAVTYMKYSAIAFSVNTNL